MSFRLPPRNSVEILKGTTAGPGFGARGIFILGGVVILGGTDYLGIPKVMLGCVGVSEDERNKP